MIEVEVHGAGLRLHRRPAVRSGVAHRCPDPRLGERPHHLGAPGEVSRHRGRAVLAIDLPGHGRSQLSTEWAMVEWLLAVLDAIGVGRLRSPVTRWERRWRWRPSPSPEGGSPGWFVGDGTRHGGQPRPDDCRPRAAPPRRRADSRLVTPQGCRLWPPRTGPLASGAHPAAERAELVWVAERRPRGLCRAPRRPRCRRFGGVPHRGDPGSDDRMLPVARGANWRRPFPTPPWWRSPPVTN